MFLFGGSIRYMNPTLASYFVKLKSAVPIHSFSNISLCNCVNVATVYLEVPRKSTASLLEAKLLRFPHTKGGLGRGEHLRWRGLHVRRCHGRTLARDGAEGKSQSDGGKEGAS